MPRSSAVIDSDRFTTFGDLLHYLRRRARLRQRDLAIATGYSEAQISRLEQNQRLPDPTVLAALFIPALDLHQEPDLARRLLDLAEQARSQAGTPPAAAVAASPPMQPLPIEQPPPPAPYEIARPGALQRLRTRLELDRHLLLSGVPGIGKTTLAAALARERAAHSAVFWYGFQPHLSTHIDTICDRLARFLAAHGYPQAAGIFEARAVGDGPHELERDLSLLMQGLNALSAAAPPLICLDNFYLVQYDPPINRLITLLLATTPATILLISREALALPGMASWELGPLEAAESDALIARLGGDNLLDERHRRRLIAKTDANPMLMRLALGQLLDRPADPQSFIAQIETSPQLARYMLETVQQRLSADAWRLLTVLALIRVPVNLYSEAFGEVCRNALAISALAPLVAELQRLMLISDPQQAQLTPFIRDYAYGTLMHDPAQRRHLHVLVAGWAERCREFLAAVAHYARAGAIEAALECLESSAELLRSQGQALAAAHVVDELLVRARSSGPDGMVLLGRLLLLRADLLVHTLRFAEAEADYRAAWAAAGEPNRRALIGSRLALSLIQRGQTQATLQVCREARALLTANNPLVLSELAVIECWTYGLLGQYQHLLAVAEQALPLIEQQLAEQLPELAARQRALIHAGLGYAWYARRRLDAARDEMQQAVIYAEHAGQEHLAWRCRTYLGHMLISAGDLQGGMSLIEAALPRMQAAGDSFTLEFALGVSALGQFLRGHHSEAAALLDGALALRQSLKLMLGPAVSEGLYPALLIGLGRLDEAQAVLDTLLQGDNLDETSSTVGYLLRWKGVLQLLRGDAAAAQASLRRALELPAAQYDGRLAAESETGLALAFRSGGMALRATRLLDLPVPAAAGPWANLERGLARALIGLLAGDPAAAEALAAVRAQALSSGYRRIGALADRISACHRNGSLALDQLAELLWVFAGHKADHHD